MAVRPQRGRVDFIITISWEGGGGGGKLGQFGGKVELFGGGGDFPCAPSLDELNPAQYLWMVQ